MATFTADKGKDGFQPRAIHAGTTTVVSTFMWGVTNADDSTTSATAAASDVIRMVKLPNQAYVTKVVYWGNRDDGAYKLGTSASASLIDAAVSLSAGITDSQVVPFKISLSDASTVAYEYLNATVVSAGYTLSDYISVAVTYHIDN